MSGAPSREPREEPDIDEVGFKRPPRHGRFRKGRSGNPKGRPKGRRNLASLLSTALNALVTVNENGKRSRISKREAIIRQLVNKSASADLKAISMVFALMEQGDGEVAPPASLEELGPADLKVLRQLGERVGRARGGENA